MRRVISKLLWSSPISPFIIAETSQTFDHQVKIWHAEGNLTARPLYMLDLLFNKTMNDVYGSHRGSFWSTEFELERTFSTGKSRDQDHWLTMTSPDSGIHLILRPQDPNTFPLDITEINWKPTRRKMNPTITIWKSVWLTRFLCKKMSLCGFRRCVPKYPKKTF